MFASPAAETLRSAVRRLRRAPGFSLLAILLLATGIGAVTVVYSLVHGILIRPLPYPAPGRLVGFEAVNHAKSVVQPALSIADFRDFRKRQHALEMLGAYRPDFATLQRPGEPPVQLSAALVTEDFFRTLGVRPLRGRTFRPGEFSVAAPRTVVLSHAVWAGRFDGDPDIVGRVVTLGGQPTTVIGVMPASFREPAFVDVWLPFPVEAPENFARDSRYWTTIGRLAPGATLGQVRAETAAIAADLARQYPDTDRGWTITAARLHELRVHGVRTSLWVLLAATGLLLLVSCLNLANLQLARGLRRTGEMALRQVLGATRRRLLGQILWESVLLGLPGGLAGVGLAWVAVRVFAARVPPTLVPRTQELGIDGPVLLVAAAASLAAGALAGLLPALQAARADAGAWLKEGTARTGVGRGVRRSLSLMVAVQIAVTFVVLTGATLLWRSLTALGRTRPGFTVAGLYLLRAAPAPSQYETNLDLARYYERLVRAAESVPGVTAAAVDASAPLAGITLQFPYAPVGAAEDAAKPEAVYHFISPDFLAATGLPLRRGRALDARDDEHRAPVALVNERLARLLSPDRPVVGRRLRLVPWMGDRPVEIVGVVGDACQANLTDPPPAQLYLAQRQFPWFFSTLLVRVAPGRALPVAALRQALHRADPSLPVTWTPLREAIARTTAQPRLLSLMFAVLGGATLAFALFGLYACTSFLVAQRTAEFGLRMALGADPARVMAEVLRGAGRLVAAGLLAGAAGAAAFGDLLRSQLHGVGAHDPRTLLATGAVLAVAGLAAALGPAVRAGRVPPAEALRKI